MLTSVRSGLDDLNVDDIRSFQSLGKFAFASNEDSEWQLRELKTVHVNRVCSRMKVMLYQPIANKLNRGDQVGIVSITCFGQQTDDRSVRTNDIRANDPQIAEQITILGARVAGAERSGDLITRNTLNEKIQNLLQLDSKLKALEADKKEAIKQEDYDLAKTLKSKIDSLRTAGSDPVTGKDTEKTMIQNLSSFLGNKSNEPTTLATFGLPDAGTLPQPDPLPVYFSRDYPQILESLGENTVALFLSRDWRLRERAVDDVINRIREGSRETDLNSVTWLIRKLTVEKMVNLTIKLCDLIQTLVSLTAEEHAILAETIEFSVIFLVEQKLADSNKRLSDAVVLTLVKLADTSPSLARLVYQNVFKGTPNAKNIAARCLCLLSLIQTIGLKGKKSVSLEDLVLHIGEWYPRSTSGETRIALMQVIAEAVRAVGQDRVEQTIRIIDSESLRESLLFELNRLPMRRTVLSPSGAVDVAIACEFCGKKDREFALEQNMDLHYWDECPALIECMYCEQVVELLGLTEHRLKECESRDASIGLID